MSMIDYTVICTRCQWQGPRSQLKNVDTLDEVCPVCGKQAGLTDEAGPMGTAQAVSNLHRHVLAIMAQQTPREFSEAYGFYLSCFVTDWITKDMARALCRDLAGRGYAQYINALWSDDGMPAGAGYGITPAGRDYLASMMKDATNV